MNTTTSDDTLTLLNDVDVRPKTGANRSTASSDAQQAGDGGENDDDEDEGEAVDMDAFLENLDEDAGAASDVVKPPEEAEDDGVLSTRTYDLNISYDNYYRTPRLWLTGYDEVGERRFESLSGPL